MDTIPSLISMNSVSGRAGDELEAVLGLSSEWLLELIDDELQYSTADMRLLGKEAPLLIGSFPITSLIILRVNVVAMASIQNAIIS